MGKLTEELKSARGKSTASRESLEAAIDLHLREIRNWSDEISFSDLRKAKLTSEVFVSLDLLLQPKRRQMADEVIDVRPLEDFLSGSERHLIILGHPGAGKTTSMKHLCQRLMREESFLPHLAFPLLLRLSELGKRIGSSSNSDERITDPLTASLQDVLGIGLIHDLPSEVPIELKGQEEYRRAFEHRTKMLKSQRELDRRVVIDVIDSFGVLLILDGFDEITSPAMREAVLAELRILGLQLENTRIVLTSRTGDFAYHIQGFTECEIHPLTDDQITEFSSHWLGAEAATRLVKKLRDSPYGDTAIRPITLAHICAIYERIGSIPDKPKTVYKKIVTLLLEQWDEQRGIHRTTGYAGFEVDRKFEFLAHLAYELTITVHSTAFTGTDLERVYERICDNFSLPKGEATNVARELESHTGLFLQGGQESFQFAHKSLQEYLAAEFIVRLPTMPSEHSGLLYMPNELAIAIAISSRPSEYFAQLMLERLKFATPTFYFVQAFTSRLLLERPDFETNDRVGGALLRLYSTYVDLMVRELFPQTMRYEPVESLNDTLKSLDEMVKTKLIGREILNTYQVKQTVPLPGGHEVLRLDKMDSKLAASLNIEYKPVSEWPSSVWAFPEILQRL